MSGFHIQRLRQLRRAAGLGGPVRRRAVVAYLEPQDASVMPSFHVPGVRLPDQDEAEYIDSRYFSPAALHWADAVVEYRAGGGTLDQDDEQCFARVWKAIRSGRKPTEAQQREYDKRMKWEWAASRIPELYAKEMNSRGVKNYGPDDPLPDDLKGPGSADELIYRYLYAELGYKSPASAKAQHKAWKRSGPVVSASP